LKTFAMRMKHFFSQLLILVLVAAVVLTGCSQGLSGTMTGDYQEDTAHLVTSLRQAINLPEDDPEKGVAQEEVRLEINDYAGRYRRDNAVGRRTSFTTMRTALNAIAGHYSAYPNRPLPETLTKRVEQELDRVEVALKRGD